MFTGTLDVLKGPVSTVNKIDGDDLISTAPAEVRLSVFCILCPVWTVNSPYIAARIPLESEEESTG